ncbi:MAG: DHH family phosphoesterase [Oscillospiraceae bacterium]|nr:DHH family phosphoesterase [Oscillospiraceae bacterium]
MKKNYGQITKTYTRAAFISALLLIAGGVFALFDYNRIAGFAEISAGIVIFILLVVIGQRRKDSISKYLDIIAKNTNVISSNLMGSFPIPVVVTHIDGSIHWYNEMFSEMFSNKDLFDMKIETVITGIKWGEVLKTPSNYEKHIRIGEKKYSLIANTIQNNEADTDDRLSVYIYLIDKTMEAELQQMYENEKTDVAIINIDNYEDVLQRVTDIEQQHILSQIRICVNEWAAQGRALLKNTDRDRYYMFFEHRYLDGYIRDKFDILYKIRKVGEDIKQPVSISIGIGTGGNLSENESYARSALDMALGRGGDQVSIKDDTQYKFFGSKARDYERSTRVKTRAFAVALKDFIKSSDKVIFMGHGGADYDCFGAAMGLQRAVRIMDKTPYILYDNNSPAVRLLYEELRDIEEYNGMFISPEEALEQLTQDTLVVVLDTHRPSMLPCPQLVERAAKTVLIDHHRRSTDFLNPCSLIYHEPYASSTCEMATELLEYMNIGSSLTNKEAECLYTGILMDTKNFLVKTGVRTFDAASYLRRLGLNTADIKQLFNVSKDDYDRRADIIRTTRIIAPHIAVAQCYKSVPNIRVVASQAADEMLNIGDIRASIVVYPIDGTIGVSARSLGEVNVQVLMEYIGGGGHSTVAGAQVRDKNVDMVVDDVINAVNEYLSNNEN